MKKIVGQQQYATPITIKTKEEYDNDKKFGAMLSQAIHNTHITQINTYSFGKRINTVTYVR
jgi:hypothetical protein